MCTGFLQQACCLFPFTLFSSQVGKAQYSSICIVRPEDLQFFSCGQQFRFSFFPISLPYQYRSIQVPA
jgi:hypothetical protein